MKILTKDNARELLGGKSLDTVIARFSNELPLVEDTFAV
jgi:hypothetical protein